MSNLATLRPNRFSSTNQPKIKNHGHKGPYLVPLLRKLLEKKITFEDPETKKLVEGTIKDVLLLRLIMNGTEGETKAIVEILDRIDGKVPTPIVEHKEDETLLETEFEIIKNRNKPAAIERYKKFLNS